MHSLARARSLSLMHAHTHVYTGVEVLEGRLYAVGGKDESGNKVPVSYAFARMICVYARKI